MARNKNIGVLAAAQTKTAGPAKPSEQETKITENHIIEGTILLAVPTKKGNVIGKSKLKRARKAMNKAKEAHAFEEELNHLEPQKKVKQPRRQDTLFIPKEAFQAINPAEVLPDSDRHEKTRKDSKCDTEEKQNVAVIPLDDAEEENQDPLLAEEAEHLAETESVGSWFEQWTAYIQCKEGECWADEEYDIEPTKSHFRLVELNQTSWLNI